MYLEIKIEMEKVESIRTTFNFRFCIFVYIIWEMFTYQEAHILLAEMSL